MNTLFRVLAASMLLALCTVSASAEPIRFVVLPDTQIYSWNLYREDAPYPDDAYTITNPEGSYPYFVDQTRWIVE
ncbi:MAG: hypothetical protein MI976_17820, partial [Pseudomonadales bacterium]|nr:hypothetical protein [Pseudomonadales bacterium]